MIFSYPLVVPNYEPTSWFGLAAILFGGFVTLVTSCVAAWGTHKARRETSALTEQITNGHKTIFRDDFDALIASLQELKDDLRQERKDRRNDVHELHQDLDRKFEHLSQRLDLAQEHRDRRTENSELRQDIDRRFDSLDHRFDR